MPRKLLASSILFCAALPMVGGIAASWTPSVPFSAHLALVDANLLTMEDERIRPGRTVLVEDGVIVAIGERDEISIPRDAQIVDCRGMFLLPGLVDMHVHICDRGDLGAFLAHGVITVRNMGEVPGWGRLISGFPHVLRLRGQIEEGAVLGPAIYTAGPILDGRPPVSPLNQVVRSAREAEKSVSSQVRQGYDFIKVYDGLDGEVFKAVMRAARGHGLPVAGHVSKKVGLEAALASGMVSIEHLTGFIDNDRANLVFPGDELAAFAARAAAAGVWQCPTLVIWENVVPPAEYRKIEAHPEARLASGRVRWLWRQTLKRVYANDYKGGDYAGWMKELSLTVARALHGAGARFVLGTDTNFVGVFPGWAAQRELELLVEAGLTPYEALQAGTCDAAACLGKSAEFGTVAVGKRADLLLLAGDPLMDIGNVRRISGVVLRGRWLAGADLRALSKR